MTLIIYIQCNDATIVILDRKESDTSQTGQITKKYYLPTNHDFFLALAGDSIRIDTIRSDLHIDQSIEASSIRNKLYGIIENSPKTGSPESISDGLLLIRENTAFKFNDVWFTTHHKSIVEIDPPFKCYGDGAQLADYLIRKFDFSKLSWKDACQYLIAIMQDVSKRVDSVGTIEDYGFDIIVIKDSEITYNTINEGNENYKIDCSFKPDQSLEPVVKITQNEEKLKESKSKKEKITTNTMSVNVNDTAFNVDYTISNGKVVKISHDAQATSLIINLATLENGELTISVPRMLLDSKIGNYDEDFFVLLDGEETDFEETIASIDRTLTITFPKGAEEIEIIGTKFTGIETKFLEQVSEQISTKEYAEKIHKHAIEHNLPIIVQTDKNVYMYNSSMIVTIINPYFVPETSIELEILDENNKQVYQKNIPVNEDVKGIYQEIVDVQGTNWLKPGAKFRIISKYYKKTAQVEIFTTDFGTSIELDKKVYTWTDRVSITIVAPDLAQDPSKIEFIGNRDDCKIKIATNRGTLQNYKLEETGPETGIFTGEITLTGFTGLDVKNDKNLNVPRGTTSGQGPKDGLIQSSESDGIIVTLITPTKTVSGSALVRWNIGEIQWLNATYPANGKGEIRIVDPDMNLNPNEIDEFKIKVWSDTDPVGIHLKVTETGKATGIFKGLATFTTNEESSEDKLRVAEGDTLTAEYIDRTLPDPYTKNDSLSITSTSMIGTLLPPQTSIESLTIRKTEQSNNFFEKIRNIIGKKQIPAQSLPSNIIDKTEKSEQLKVIMNKPLVRIPQGTSVPGCEERNECYMPPKLSVRVNETVIWKNEDTAAHTVTSGTPDQGHDGNFDSSLFMSGQSFAVKLTKKGEYPYFCIVHPWQTGTIIVE